MANGISLHIGLNSIDPAHYGTPGTLRGCENDAHSMQRVASSLGYRSQTLLTADARAEDILAGIRDAAAELRAGNTFLLTYAGHGAQILDANADEDDGQDETWCAYDRMIVDDELFALWPLFRPGVLVVMVSDSCHSGTVARMVWRARELRAAEGDTRAFEDEEPSYRTLPRELVEDIYIRNRALYDGLRAQRARDLRPALQAGVILLSGCQDHQLSADGQGNGVFTESLLRVWNEGRFEGDYASFTSDVQARMPRPLEQTPSFRTEGAGAQFSSRKPFVIEAVPKGCDEATVTPVPTPAQETCLSTKPTQIKEPSMSNYVENGNWEEVSAALSQQMQVSRGGDRDFLSKVIASNAQAAEAAYFGAPLRPDLAASVSRGGSVTRSFWWGFHIEISHDDLVNALAATDPNGPIVIFLRRVLPQNYHVWINVVTPFVVAGASLLRALDRGRGVYISMSWFVPGVFIPTTV